MNEYNKRKHMNGLLNIDCRIKKMIKSTLIKSGKYPTNKNVNLIYNSLVKETYNIYLNGIERKYMNRFYKHKNRKIV